MFSHALCPNVSWSYFAGFRITFTPISDSQLLVNFTGDNIFNAKNCQIPLDPQSPISIRISKQGTEIGVARVHNRTQKFTCPAINVSNLIEFGYISLFAVSPSNCTDCFSEMKGLNFFPISDDNNSIDPDLPKWNRKFLEDTKHERSGRKMRRRAAMSTVSKYVSRDDRDLTGDKVDLSDALRETAEMVRRANGCVSAVNFSTYIYTKVIPVLTQAQARFERVADAIFGMKAEMLSMWEDAKRDLKVMNGDIRQTMMQVENEAVEAGKEIQSRMLPQTVAMVKPKVGWFDRTLFTVSVAEFLCFVAFFVQYHRRNLARKKV
jgi:hypothetical protein